MTRKFTYTPVVADKQWGFLNEEFDDLYDNLFPRVTQANTFSAGDMVGLSGGSWSKAQAGITEALGVVVSASSSEFTVAFTGSVVRDWTHGLTIGSLYYVSTTAGAVDSSPPGPGVPTQTALVPLSTTSVLVHISEAIE